MSDDIVLRMDESDSKDSPNKTVTDFTQIASCSVGESPKERRRQSLKAKLEREQYDREQQTTTDIFATTFRNLFGKTG